MNDTPDEALNVEADALRGRFISRVADLERGIDANLYLFFGVDQDKEALFRSTLLANLGLAAKIGAIRHIVALYELKADPQFGTLPGLLERCNHVRNVLAHGRRVRVPLTRRDDGREILTISWARKGKEALEEFDTEGIFRDASQCNEGLLFLLRETLQRYPINRNQV